MLRFASIVAAIFLASANMVNASPNQILLLEVWINGHTDHRIVRVGAADGRLRCNAADLVQAGLRLDSDNGSASLDDIAGVSFKVDAINQRLLITASAERVPVQSFDLRPPIGALPQSTSAVGAILDYDASGAISDLAHARQSATMGSTLALNVFAPDVLFTAAGFATSQQSARLDTSLEFDDPEKPRHIILGDAISGSADWSRAFRFGGIEIASDYALRPDLVTFPLPSFFGHAGVPETIDVLVGSTKVFEENIDEGPFALHDLPVVTGGGSATVVTTDVLGRETSQTVSLYTTTQLLAPGLTDYSFDAGFLRDGYGERSFDYGAPAASFLYRRGFDEFTASFHAESTPGLVLAGAEIALSLGSFGVVSGAHAISYSADKLGQQLAFNFQSRIGPVDGFVSAQSATGQDVAGLEDGAPSRLRLQVGLTAPLSRGSLAVSWVRESQNSEGESNEAIASYSLPIGNGWFVNFTGLRDFADHHWAAQFFVGVPIGGGIASASYSGGSSSSSLTAAFSAPPNPDGGFGYDVSAGSQGGIARAEADATWIAQQTTLEGAVASASGQTGLRAGASGAFVLLNGGLFAAHQPDGAMALVEAGEPNVHIYRDNRDVATSDSDGQALLTGLVPYTENHIAIEPRDYAMSSVVADSDRTVVPQRSSAVIVDLAPKRAHPALLVVRFSDGQAPTLGTVATVLKTASTLMVGRDGEIFIPDLPTNEDLSLSVGNQSCVLHVVAPIASTRIPRIGPVICNLGVPA